MSDATERDPVATVEGASDLDWESLFALLGRAHTKAVLYEVAVKNDPPVRFSDLQGSLELSPNTLSRRLDELEAAGFLVRRSYDEIPPRVEYEPTERLYALEPAFRELDAWLAEYGAADAETDADETETGPAG
jgi:DNA-binding HxlR family transcriptional regulator